ncbi:MAG: peptidase T [Clostridia bacterium]|nr:peptidase T [Clostridia bacterium]
MKPYERLLDYVQFGTASDEESGKTPSTDSQFLLARHLKEEMIRLGLSDVRLTDSCYLYAKIPATEGLEDRPVLGFISHMDTSPDFSGHPVRPRLIENYDLSDIPLGNTGKTLSVSNFPHLSKLRGRTLIVTDGTSLLGADDKAGIAEILTTAEILLSENRPHGPIRVAFTPDEEIGEGADHFDLAAFDADLAYTVDGSEEGGIEYENFNAAGAEVVFSGFNIHPGDAKDRMINAASLACDFVSSIPAAQTPRETDGYRGFFHLTGLEGNVEKARLSLIVRDHDEAKFEEKKAFLKDLEKKCNDRYGEGTCRVTIKEQYRNMRQVIEEHMELIEAAKKACVRAGVQPVVSPIRGGTDGARLSFMGLPCPNLGTGGYAFHGPYEHITVEGMDLSVKILLGIVEEFSH